MSRVNENKDLLQRVPKEFVGASKDILAETNVNVLAVLMDISMSLAEISDTLKGGKHE